MDRRNFLVAATASLLCAPAIVRASSLMPIKVVGWTPLVSPVNEVWERGERPSAGWAERMGYQMMDHVLKTGWTPERADSFYGGISESKMRNGCLRATTWLLRIFYGYRSQTR